MVFSASGAVAQNFNYSLLASYSKLGYVYDNNFHLSTKGYHNGFQLGALVSFVPKTTIIEPYSGVAFSKYYHTDYNLNFLSVPVGINLLVGKKTGFSFGGGIKVWYLMSIPENFTYLVNTKQVFISYSAQLALLFRIREYKISVGPQIDTFQTSIDESKYGEYFNILSLNLIFVF